MSTLPAVAGQAGEAIARRGGETSLLRLKQVEIRKIKDCHRPAFAVRQVREIKNCNPQMKDTLRNLSPFKLTELFLVK